MMMMMVKEGRHSDELVAEILCRLGCVKHATQCKCVSKGRASDISVLSDELVAEILCRLGCVKQATRCKSVCKLWCSLVDTDAYWPHRWRHEKESLTLITWYDYQVIEITTNRDYRGCGPLVHVDLSFLPQKRAPAPSRCPQIPPELLGSHKDLLLCCRKVYGGVADHSCYYICNRLTKQWTALPPPPPPGRRPPTNEELRCISLRTQVQFIVDERADKFTVVRIIPYHVLPRCGRGLYDGKAQVSVFSPDVGWREMDDRGGWREMFQAKRSCQKILPYRGSLVWLMTEEDSDQVMLYSWDLHSNCTRLPLITNADYKFVGMATIGVCEGRLRIARVLDEYTKLVVWELDDSEGKEWDMLLKLNLRSIRKCWKRGGEVSIGDMAFHPHDKDILYMLVKMRPPLILPEKAELSRIYMFSLKRKRQELQRRFPLNIVSGAQFFPLEKNCWPTPIPRLQP